MFDLKNCTTVLCNSFSEQETQRLREVLLTCSEIRWLGATAGTLEASFRYQHAFYEFFKKYSLVGLPREETQELLLQLAKLSGQEPVMQRILKQQPGRVETLRILTGGVIRTIVVLFEIFMDHDSGNAIHDLEKILDRVTPLYKHRMEDLPPLRREVVTALAMNWDGMKLAEVARKLRREVAEVEAPLAELKKVNLVEMKVVDAQTQWYFLEERFFNIWYLMRLATGAKMRVIWLVRFLEAWYDREQLMERAKLHIRALKNNPEYSPKAAYVYTEAFKETGMLDWKSEYELNRETKEFLESHDKSLARELSPADQELFEQAASFYNKKEYKQAKALLLKIRQPDRGTYFRLGYCSYALNNFEESKGYYLMVIEKWDKLSRMPKFARIIANFVASLGFRRVVMRLFSHPEIAAAMNNLGSLYHVQFKVSSEAERYYLMAVDRGSIPTMNNLGMLYQNEFKDYPKAEHYYLMALEHGEQGFAFWNLFRMYRDILNKPQKAEACSLAWAEKGHPKALNKVAWDYFEGKIHKHTALCCAEQAFEKDKANYHIAHTLACIYVWHNRFAEAVEVAKVFIGKEDFYEKYSNEKYQKVDEYFLLLLAKQEYTIVHDYFDDPQLTLKDRFKPIYYAFLKLTNDPEFGRMPPELEETVTQLLAKVEEMAKDYA